MIIRESIPSDIESINEITKSLHPKWFDQGALKNIPIDAQINNCYVAEDNNVVGFIVFSSQDGEIKINWLGINPNFHRKGIGSRLLDSVIKYAQKYDSQKIIVETVIEQSPKDGSYDETMKFYEKQEFKVRKKYPQEHFNEFTFSKGILEKDIN